MRNHNGGAFCSEKPEVAENQAKDQSDETTDETFFQARHRGSRCAMPKRRRRHCGKEHLVFDIRKKLNQVFPLHQVELLIAVLREGGVRLEDKEVFKRKLLD